MAKMKLDNDDCMLLFHCPGCGFLHAYRVKHDEYSKKHNHPVWKWEGDLDNPTLSPSLLHHKSNDYPRCHLFVRGGQIVYCGDCEHELAGKTVDMEDRYDGKAKEEADTEGDPESEGSGEDSCSGSEEGESS